MFITITWQFTRYDWFHLKYNISIFATITKKNLYIDTNLSQSWDCIPLTNNISQSYLHVVQSISKVWLLLLAKTFYPCWNSVKFQLWSNVFKIKDMQDMEFHWLQYDELNQSYDQKCAFHPFHDLDCWPRYLKIKLFLS